jgi:hypothetical protein
MNDMLLVYYGFLVATLVFLVAFNGSSLLPHPRKVYVAELLVPPLILLVVLLKLGFVATLILTILLMVVSKWLLARYQDAGVTRLTVYYSLGLCLLDAVAPLSVHFALRSHPEAENLALLIGGFFLLLAPILVLGIWAPDLRKNS